MNEGFPARLLECDRKAATSDIVSFLKRKIRQCHTLGKATYVTPIKIDPWRPSNTFSLYEKLHVLRPVRPEINGFVLVPF